METKTFLLFILLLNLSPCFGASDSSSIKSIAKDRDLVSFNRLYQSDSANSSVSSSVSEWIPRSWEAIGRTFGRPFIKKAIAGLIPLAFQMGAASTWLLVSALIGFKTLLVAGAILKLLLLAGAAKIGALFSSKSHGHHEQTWDPHKQIHVHIHNGHHETQDEYISSPWSRISDPSVNLPAAQVQPVNVLQALQAYNGLTSTTTPSTNWFNAIQAYITPGTTTQSPINVLQALQAYVNTVTTTPSPINMLQILAAATPGGLLQNLQQPYAGNIQNLEGSALQPAGLPVHTGPQTISTPFGTYLKIDKMGSVTK